MYYAIFLNKNGYNGEKEKATEAGLKEGEKYEVVYASIGQSHSNIELDGIDGDFNSVMFDYVDENGNEADIFENPYWNPYL